MSLTVGATPGPEPLTQLPPQRTSRLIGVEEELLLVDAETFATVPAAGEVLRSGTVPLPNGSAVEAEVKREQIEVVSPPLGTHSAVLEAIVAGRRAADRLAQGVGARAVALATAADDCHSHLVHSSRYERMQERFGLLMDEQLTCGFHVHVTISSAQEGVAVLDRIRPWLPVLLALSANSPFWRGADSHFDSYRYQAWSRWPSAGAYDRFHSTEGYLDTVAGILGTGVSLDTGMIYFDARLSTHAPTVEIRIADVCFAPQDAACLAVLMRALVEAAAAQWRAGIPAADTPTLLLRLASWRASRWGVGSELVSPITGRRVPASVAVDELLQHVAGHFANAEEERIVREGVGEILCRGNGAAQQRRARALDGGTAGVIREALARVYQGPAR